MSRRGAIGLARSLSDSYLQSLADANSDTVLGRTREYWWPHFKRHLRQSGPEAILDGLDRCMDAGRGSLNAEADAYADRVAKGDAAIRSQRRSQFLKSNTGKMFERFAGLALAKVLRDSGSKYTVQPFTTKSLAGTTALRREQFFVSIELGGETLQAPIDADLIVFAPADEALDVFMVSVKSTLKDRFHNVPFWNLLRRSAVSNDFPAIVGIDSELLSRCHYIAICTDLAEEQPDFRGEGGPRNLLKLDAALLDGAFVSASNAIGVGSVGPVIGPERSCAFHKLSLLLDHLNR